MPTETTPFDGAEHPVDAESQRVLIKEAFESGDPRSIAHALGVIARMRGMTQIAKDTGVRRETLYRSLCKDGNPRLGTLTSVLSALGVTMSADLAVPPPAA